MTSDQGKELRRGWTTGACATAATAAAYEALLTGAFLDPVTIALGGKRPAFALAAERRGEDSATAGVVKDAGDDPDVTHGALVLSTVRESGAGVTFRAGGVGTVTLPGLRSRSGELAINPAPREMTRGGRSGRRRPRRPRRRRRRGRRGGRERDRQAQFEPAPWIEGARRSSARRAW